MKQYLNIVGNMLLSWKRRLTPVFYLSTLAQQKDTKQGISEPRSVCSSRTRYATGYICLNRDYVVDYLLTESGTSEKQSIDAAVW